mmetsp:Transcript_123030/g.223653  ORF Transcript_123030/g.223653 Transcript_123030/m.223653 type:complete len:409 (+) Transcript_123030:69-1295(+)
MEGDGADDLIILEGFSIIVEDDARPSKRLRSVKSSADIRLPDISRDAQLALSLQMAEFGCAPVESVDVTDAPIIQRQVSKTVRVKLYFTDKTSVVVHANPYAQLASLFSEAAVAKLLRGFVGADQALHLADSFDIHRSLPQPCAFDRSLAERTSILDAIGEHGGVLHMRAKGSGNDKSAIAPRGVRNPGSTMVASAPGESDGVDVLRFRTPDGNLGSPVVLVKNFNRDRGVLLARLTDLKGMVEAAPWARKGITNNVREELDSHKRGRLNFTTEVRRASDRVLDIGEEAIKNDLLAKDALAHRTEYASTAVLVYGKDTTLPRHVDGCGHWVVLFSFGLTVDFFAGDRSFQFESGDALIFNGSARHHVLHGIDRVHDEASLRGENRKLPEELSYLSDIRASFQSRQGDA